MEWQGLRTLFTLHFYDLPKLVSLPMGLQYKYSSQDDSFFLKLFFLRIVEVEGKELKAVGDEPLSDGRCGLRIHG
ncbi:hypothetical protein CFP56_007608 [Quercus suber]|uniref:Uncharacterized protein n=1 Tax=Quercus suber TaxID=58331 RepID=A0AAW0L5T8_QUESU